MQRFGDARDWIFDKRFGMFVHWGLYSLGAWHEQHQWRGRISVGEYEKQINHFNPVNYDPDAWLDVAEAAGMQYICLTTKHHDGFCLWDTNETDYNIMNTPYGKDTLKMLAEACERRGFPLCLYYSVVDWHHPNYPNQGRSHELETPIPGGEPDMQAYTEFLKAQVRELCTNYGPIAGIWWDMNVTGIVDPSINNMIRELQPGAVINNRGFDEGDFGTPERCSPNEEQPRIYDTPVEHCQSVGRESWGYRENEDYYSDVHLQRSLVTALARGGRFLLNVGPKADGTLPQESIDILGRLGEWYKFVREAYDDTVAASDLVDNPDILVTRKDNVVYVHLFKELEMSRVVLNPIQDMPKSVTLLNTEDSLPASTDPLPSYIMSETGSILNADERQFLRIYDLPINEMANTTMILRLEFESDAKVFNG